MRPGPRDHLITEALARKLEALDPSLVVRDHLDAAEAPSRLAQHLARVVQRALGSTHDSEQRARLINQLIALAAPDDAGDLIVIPPEVWEGLQRPPERLGDKPTSIAAPSIPLATSD